MDHVEKLIQEAQERGDFDNLPGRGKPLDLSENPFVPPDWRLAYHLLSSNGFAPALVEDDKALRARISALEERLAGFARRWEGWRRGRWTEEQRRTRLEARQGFLREYEEELRAINARIHSFNVSAPRAMARGTLPVAPMLATAAARLPIEGL